ncbi:BON1-associated protein 2, partial [Mucuna pruriens]
MATKSRTLELTVLSAEGLRVRGKPSNKKAFAVVRAESLTSHTTAMTTGNNGFHTWNEKFSVEVGPNARSLTFEVTCKAGMGVRDVSVARIALSDFLGGLVPDHCLQFLSYRLRDWDGRKCGIVNFSVRVVAPLSAAGAPWQLQLRAENDCSSSAREVVTGIPLCAYLQLRTQKIPIAMEGKSHQCTLEITVISGENISVDRSSVAENVYVVVRAESLNCSTTKMAKEDGGVHAWNEKFLLDIPSHARSVTFEVQCIKYKGVRPIGVARIALSDILSGNNIASESVPQMFCYGLRNWEGRRNGVIHFSVRVVTQEGHMCPETKQEKDPTTLSCRKFEDEVVGFQVDPKNSSHVVGIPIFRWTLSGTVLEITVISGENLRVTEEPYVVVRAESLNCCSTKMVKDSGSNNSSLFSWNEKLMLNMPLHARCITFEVQCNRFKALRPVGIARIAVSDFLGGSEPENCLLSYQLWDWEGKGNGVIHFEVRVVAPEERSDAAVEPVMGTALKMYPGDRFVAINIDDNKPRDNN